MRGAVAAAALVSLAAAGIAARAAAAPAAPTPFFEAADSAPLVVLGRVRDPRRVDRHGVSATLVVERVLVGDAPSQSRLRIAWEQFDPARPPRFGEGTRWLMALAAFPGGSLWLERFPDALRGSPVWLVGARGGGVVSDPDAASLESLAVWLALGADARRGPAGVRALAGVVERAEPELARGAVARLDELPALGALVDAAATAALGRTLVDASRPLATRRAVAELAGRRRLDALRPALEQAARSGSELRAHALDALATLDGGIPEDRLESLLADADPEVRAVALRHAPHALPAAELERMVRSGREPALRRAALGALAARDDPRAVNAAADALVDSDRGVRAQAALVITTRGEAAVPVLRERAFAGSDEAAAAAVAALGLVGPEGSEALAELAERHPDERIRRIARFARGRRGERH